MGDEVSIRPAVPGDRSALWEWYNYALRRVAFPDAPALAEAEFSDWFRRQLAAEGCALCVAVVDILRIGAVHFARCGERQFAVNLYLKPMYCGKGYAPRVLAAALRWLSGSRPVGRVVANIREVNPASRQIFADAGFSSVISDDGVCRWEWQPDQILHKAARI